MFRFVIVCAHFFDHSLKTADPWAAQENAGLACALALFLHSPVSVVTDTARLANDQVVTTGRFPAGAEVEHRVGVKRFFGRLC